MTARGTVLVFGVAGFAGVHLVHEFASVGYVVAGADRADRLPSPPEGLADYTQADVRDDGRVGHLIHSLQPDIIVNLAALTSVPYSWEHPRETLDANTAGSVNILEAAKELETPPKLLFIGSALEYRPSPNPLDENAPLAADSPYSIAKLAQERFAAAYAERYGLQIYRTRSFRYTGPGQDVSFPVPAWCNQVARLDAEGGGVLRASDLDAVRDYSDVRDVVRAYRLILESDYAGELFNVGSGIGRRAGDVLDEIISFSSNPIRVEVSTEGEQDRSIFVSSNEKLRTLLGWEPEYHFSDTLREVYNQFI